MRSSKEYSSQIPLLFHLRNTAESQTCDQCSRTRPCTWDLMPCGYSLGILNSFIFEFVFSKWHLMGQFTSIDRGEAYNICFHCSSLLLHSLLGEVIERMWPPIDPWARSWQSEAPHLLPVFWKARVPLAFPTPRSYPKDTPLREWNGLETIGMV